MIRHHRVVLLATIHKFHETSLVSAKSPYLMKTGYLLSKTDLKNLRKTNLFHRFYSTNGYHVLTTPPSAVHSPSGLSNKSIVPRKRLTT